MPRCERDFCAAGSVLSTGSGSCIGEPSDEESFCGRGVGCDDDDGAWGFIAGGVDEHARGSSSVDVLRPGADKLSLYCFAEGGAAKLVNETCVVLDGDWIVRVGTRFMGR